MTTVNAEVPSDRALMARPARRSSRRTTAIDSLSALSRLRRSAWIPQLTTSGARIVFHEDALGAEAKRAEARVNALYDSCGCGAGGVAVVATAVGLASWWALGSVRLDGRAVLISLGALVAAAVGGKLAGIVWSRVALYLLLRRLERRLTAGQAG